MLSYLLIAVIAAVIIFGELIVEFVIGAAIWRLVGSAEDHIDNPATPTGRRRAWMFLRWSIRLFTIASIVLIIWFGVQAKKRVDPPLRLLNRVTGAVKQPALQAEKVPGRVRNAARKTVNAAKRITEKDE